MKVLVTGATGFLGTWTVQRLLEEGAEVRILRRRTSQLGELEGLPLESFEGDVTDVQSLTAACRGADSVFHLAGLIAYSRADRALMERVNVGGTANVLTACREARVRRLVHLSSVVAIGASFDGAAPLNESSTFDLHDLDLGYFQTKHHSELLVSEAVRTGDLDAVILNPSTIYGAGDARKGSRAMQLKVARGKMPFYTSGGVNVVAVEDVIDAMMAAWKRGRAGERYIVAGENILIRDLFGMIAKEAGVSPPQILLPNSLVHWIGKAGDALERIGRKGPINSETAWTSTLFHWFDNSKARQELGLNPQPARQAIARSVDWVRRQGLLDD